MNIEDIFNSRMAPTPPCHSSVENRMPPCQNTMFPNPHQYQYQPLIHVPTRTNTATLGEMGASVDMLRAQLTELSKRMDTMESRVSKFESSVSNDIFLLKSTLSEHATELLHIRDTAEHTHAHVKKTNELIEEQDFCIDRLADIIRQTGMKTVASNIDLGTIRRRLSRVEDFTSEFYEQFESFKGINDIFSSLSDHIDECDRDISSFVMKNNNNNNNNNNYDNYDNLDDDVPLPLSLSLPCSQYSQSDLENYFLNYEEQDNSNSNDGDIDGRDHVNESKNNDNSDEYDTNNLVIFMKYNHQEQDVQSVQSIQNVKDDDFERL
jgi:hypothetical protein